MEKPFRYIYPECPACKIEKCTLSAPLFNSEDGGCNNPAVMERLHPNNPIVLVPEEWKSRALAAEARVRELEDVLREVLTEAEQLSEGEGCDHSVGVCWCSHFEILSKARQALEGGTPDE